MPGIVAGVVLGFAKTLGEFGATITFVAAIPGETLTLPADIYLATQTPGGRRARGHAVRRLGRHRRRGGDGLQPHRPPAQSVSDRWRVSGSRNGRVTALIPVKITEYHSPE